MKKYFLHSILIIVFVFSLYSINNSAQAVSVSMKDESTSTLYSYTTSCSGSFKGNIGVIVPKGASSFEATYLYFHGNDYPTAKYMCESYGGHGLCPLAQELGAPIIIPEINDVYTSFTKAGFQCILDEAKNNLSTTYGINLPSNYIVTGHSAGVGMVNKFLASGMNPDLSVLFDGCYFSAGNVNGNWCHLIADKSNSGNIYLYYATTDPTTGAINAYTAHPNKVFPFKVTAGHTAVPGLCFLDHINDDLCDGKAVYEGTSSLPTPTAKAVTGAATNITINSATLEGTVNTNDDDSAFVYFQYAEDEGFDILTPVYSTSVLIPADEVAGNADVDISASIEDLEPGTTYHYRLKMMSLNNDVTILGDDKTFKTETANIIPTTTSTTSTTSSASTTTTTSSGGAGLVPCTENCGFSDVFKLINNVVHFILFDMAIPIAAIMFAYAGFLLITSGGEVSKKTKAKSIFTNVAIGLIVAVAAFLIIKTILSIVGYKSDWNWFGF